MIGCAGRQCPTGRWGRPAYGAVDGLPLALSDGLVTVEELGDALSLGMVLLDELGEALGGTTGTDGRVGLGVADGLHAAMATTRPPTTRSRLSMGSSWD